MKVYVVGGDYSVERMFEEAGHEVGTHNKAFNGRPDLYCFTGGADINPALYGQEIDGARGINYQRDEFEVEKYQEAKSLGIPMVGICRGAQLFNALQGGSLIQHIGPFHGNTDAIWTNASGKNEVGCTMHVCHHQGIVPNPASEQLMAKRVGQDILSYAFWNDSHETLGFQAHPEWGHKETRDSFFELIEEFI